MTPPDTILKLCETFTDRQIDTFVYRLYDVIPEEIAIVGRKV